MLKSSSFIAHSSRALECAIGLGRAEPFDMKICLTQQPLQFQQQVALVWPPSILASRRPIPNRTGHELQRADPTPGSCASAHCCIDRRTSLYLVSMRCTWGRASSDLVCLTGG